MCKKEKTASIIPPEDDEKGQIRTDMQKIITDYKQKNDKKLLL